MTPGRATAGSPRTVLYLAWAPFFSGAERALLLTVQNLDPARYRPHVVLGTSGETLGAFRAAGLSCEVVSIARLDRRHPLRWAASVARVARTARRVGAAIIHSNDAPSFQPGGYAARVLRPGRAVPHLAIRLLAEVLLDEDRPAGAGPGRFDDRRRGVNRILVAVRPQRRHAAIGHGVLLDREADLPQLREALDRAGRLARGAQHREQQGDQDGDDADDDEDLD